MKRKIALALALLTLASSVAALSSCKKKCEEHKDANYDAVCDVCALEIVGDPQVAKPGELWNEEAALESLITDGTYSKATLVANLENMYVSSSTSDLVLFRGNVSVAGKTDAVIINTATGQAVYEHVKENDGEKVLSSVEVYFRNEESFYCVKTVDSTDAENVVYTQTVYTSLGKKIDSKTYKNSPEYVYHVTKELYSFNNKVYEIVDGELEHKLDITLAAIPAYDYESDNYYYKIESDGFFVYEKSLGLVSSYETPLNTEDAYIHVLANENILIQLITVLPEDANDYDLFIDGNKFEFRSYVYNVETNTKSEISLDFIVKNIMNKIAHDETADNTLFENIVSIVRIEDKAPVRALDSDNNQELVSINNEGKILALLSHGIPSQMGPAYIVSSNRFVAQDKSGKAYLLDENGVVLGEVSNAQNIEFGKYLSFNGKYYNLNLELILDSNDSDYITYGSNNGRILFYKTLEDEKNEYYVFDGELKKIAIDGAARNIHLTNDYIRYSVTDDDVSYYVFCNYDGSEIFRIKSSEDVSVNKYGDLLIFNVEKYENSGYIDYYYVSVIGE